jgi:hypothetical protein
VVRLTDVERAERTVSGAALQQQIADLAVLLGWEWCHWRALRDRRGIYKVPVEGTIGKGWPDMTLVRTRDRRLVFAEIKRELEATSPDQDRVLDVLRTLELDPAPDGPAMLPRIEVYVWRPSDLRDPIESSRIYEVLR